MASSKRGSRTGQSYRRDDAEYGVSGIQQQTKFLKPHARWGAVTLQAQHPKSDSEDSELQFEEKVVTGLHGTVYDAAFALTVRGLRDGRAATAQDALIISMCTTMPSLRFFCALEFMFCMYLYGHASVARTLAMQIYKCPVVGSREETAEELDENMVIQGLMSTDFYWMLPLLVLPKLAMTVLLWYIGSAFLAYSSHITTMATRALLLVALSQFDHVVFETFFSMSKKDWVRKCEVVQITGRCARVAMAWPGELAKFASILAAVGLSYYLFRGEFSLRGLCWQCSRDCTHRCSEVFGYCAQAEKTWPWLHGL